MSFHKQIGTENVIRHQIICIIQLYNKIFSYLHYLIKNSEIIFQLLSVNTQT